MYNGVVGNPLSLSEVSHNLGITIEGIGEFLWSRPVAVADSRVVWRYQVIAISQPLEQRLEHA
jgi:hypothetical protein